MSDFLIIPTEYLEAVFDQLECPSVIPMRISDRWSAVLQAPPRAVSRPVSGVYAAQGRWVFAASTDATAKQVSNSVGWSNGRFTLNEHEVGVYGAAVVRSDWEDLICWASRPNTRPVFWSHTSAGSVVSSRAKECAIAASVLTGRAIRKNPDYARSVLLWGYALDGVSPFQGVEVLKPGAVLRISANGVPPALTSPLRANLELGLFGEQEGASELARVLISSVNRIPKNSSVVLRLSGGKDSRTLLAALVAAGRSVVAETRGRPSDDEVKVAWRLSQLAGIDFRISPVPKASEGNVEERVLATLNRLAGFIPSEAHQSVFGGAGMINPGGVLLMGQSHIQRGGFARTMANSLEKSRRVLLGQMASRFVHPDVQLHGLNYLDSWLAANMTDNFLELLYEFHVQHRAGAYLAPHMLDYSAEAELVYPMIDSSFVRVCDRLPMVAKVSERAVQRAISIMAPELLTIPLASAGWRAKFLGTGVSEEQEPVTDLVIPIEDVAADRSEDYSPLQDAAVHDVVKSLVDGGLWEGLRSNLSPQFEEELQLVSQEGLAPLRRSCSAVALLDWKKYVWRLYNVALWQGM
ncbi:MAG: hypothetical protein Q4B08_05520 [Propionibacteriaceae bacterium]|nr:hypothetical protein [Propionibacteriaceae bacterium]